MTRLSRATLGQLPKSIAAPRGRSPLGTGIVHFGPGAFHRAHQAAFVDVLLDDDPRWGIAAVSLRTRATVAALADQDGLYTLAIRDTDCKERVIGAHSAFLGPEDASAVHALLADPAVRLVTSTVTEKGYCFAPDGTLDFAHPDIEHDLAAPAAARSLVGWLVAGLSARRAQGLAPFAAMPCDNLADNGRKLHAALIAFAERNDVELARWIAGEVRVPSTMVDSITPASDPALYALVADALALEDRAAVQRESFAQWVIEDVGPLGPDLAAAGATLTSDVAGFERAKLRILNGAHSTLAYAGSLRGHVSVAAAMDDTGLAAFVQAMVLEEIVPTVGAVSGLDLAQYVQAVFARFRNPAIVHRLDQIAQDGSQKLPYRLGDALLAQRRAGRMPHRLCAAYGAWMAFVRQRLAAGLPVIDPAAAELAALVDRTAMDFANSVARAGIGIPSSLVDDHLVIGAIAAASENPSQAIRDAMTPC